jgi:hypothetical protein
MTADELAEERAELQRKLQAQTEKETEMSKEQQAPLREPAWASALREQGTEETEIQRLIADDQARLDVSVRGALHDELSKLTKRATETQGAMAKALKGYKEDNPEFDKAAFDEFLAGDSAVKEVYDALNSQSKFDQAIDYVWTKRLRTGKQDKQVSERSRRAAQVPATPAGVRQQREEQQTQSGPAGKSAGGKNIPQEVLDAVAYNADDQSIREYMRHRRKNTALDLDAEPPSHVNLNRR